jgi:hypothetical protein
MQIWTKTALVLGGAGLAGCAQGAVTGGAAGGPALSGLPSLRGGRTVIKVGRTLYGTSVNSPGAAETVWGLTP